MFLEMPLVDRGARNGVAATQAGGFPLHDAVACASHNREYEVNITLGKYRQPGEPGHKSGFASSAACHTFASHPLVYGALEPLLPRGPAARRPGAAAAAGPVRPPPLFIVASQYVVADHFHTHHLHTDLEALSSPACASGLFTLWLLFEGSVRVSLVEGSSRVPTTPDHIALEKGCPTSQRQPHPEECALERLCEYARDHLGYHPLRFYTKNMSSEWIGDKCSPAPCKRQAKFESKSAPGDGHDERGGGAALLSSDVLHGFGFAGSAWHEVADSSPGRGALLVAYATLECALTMRKPLWPYDLSPAAAHRLYDTPRLEFVPIDTSEAAARAVGPQLRRLHVGEFDLLPQPPVTRRFLRLARHLYEHSVYSSKPKALDDGSAVGAAAGSETEDLSYIHTNVSCEHAFSQNNYIKWRKPRDVRGGSMLVLRDEAFSDRAVQFQNYSGDVRSVPGAFSTSHFAALVFQTQRWRAGGSPPHAPHSEGSDELCVCVEGEVEYALSFEPSCDVPYSVVRVRKGDVVFLPAGVVHTSLPSSSSDSVEMCFKYYTQRREKARTSPYAHSPLSEQMLAAAQLALKGSNRVYQPTTPLLSSVEPGEFAQWVAFELKNQHIPWYYRILAKFMRFGRFSGYRMHVDRHDLFIVPVEGPIAVEVCAGARFEGTPEESSRATPEGDTEVVVLSPGSVGFVPAGCKHGFKTEDAHADVVFIEVQAGVGSMHPQKP
eukprot:TRINITY_DN3705_c0_g1_i1.p1 TRINITY_DN3705_c0_g1~~TRINITY_DN3705_c0_g1_i1.p1  ORF type:complete len:720 (-),score=129.30 TRINITY_DN3705_c0_g1_i1:297-2456(-)